MDKAFDFCFGFDVDNKNHFRFSERLKKIDLGFVMKNETTFPNKNRFKFS